MINKTAGLPMRPLRRGNRSVAASQQGRPGKRAAGGKRHFEAEWLLGAKAIVQALKAFANQAQNRRAVFFAIFIEANYIDREFGNAAFYESLCQVGPQCFAGQLR